MKKYLTVQNYMSKNKKLLFNYEEMCCIMKKLRNLPNEIKYCKDRRRIVFSVLSWNENIVTFQTPSHVDVFLVFRV